MSVDHRRRWYVMIGTIAASNMVVKRCLYRNALHWTLQSKQITYSAEIFPHELIHYASINSVYFRFSFEPSRVKYSVFGSNFRKFDEFQMKRKIVTAQVARCYGRKKYTQGRENSFAWLS